MRVVVIVWGGGVFVGFGVFYVFFFNGFLFGVVMLLMLYFDMDGVFL